MFFRSDEWKSRTGTYMDPSLFIQGMIIGLTLAVPVGPIALMCIQRAVTDGRFHGIVSGIGVATADSFYAGVTFFGLTAISGLIIAHQFSLRLAAGVVLILVGIRIILIIPAPLTVKTEHETYVKDYLSMVAIAIANPLTLIFFVAILPGFGVVFYENSLLSASEFVGGVFFGSTLWWIILCGSIGSVRSRISAEKLRFINRISGVMIVCFGVGMLVLLALPYVQG
ncbi:MAG: lysine transporter LysE [Methanomicrobiales archaeon HGW-Methanomicrobiales-1]|jgi:threonine/homoserine/homoserine lactone efflux protein|nr:MAG: lysine transporter LysE [Methanomicrobiales archaeon HGW-Methanomicrobiales-1]